MAVFLGGLTFFALVTIGLWSAGQYEAMPDAHSESMHLAGFDVIIGYQAATRQEPDMNTVGVLGTWLSLYVFSLSTAFSLIRYHARYFVVTVAIAVLIAIGALRYSVADWVIVIALTPAFLFLVVWGIAVGPGWEKR